MTFHKSTTGLANKTHGMSKTTEYNSWKSIKSRCFNSQDAAFDRYGGAGVTMCDGLRYSFETFYNLVGLKPSAAHSIDRYPDKFGGYWCGRCSQCLTNGWIFNLRWATPREQSGNTRKNRYLTDGKETLLMAEWARRLDASPQTIFHRIKSGMSEHDAVTIPVRRDSRYFR